MSCDLNISFIAEKACVSKSTVSNYLNSKTNKMSKATKDRIDRVIAEYNYIPNYGARMIKKNIPCKKIGILIGNVNLQTIFSVPFYGLMMSGIGETLNEEGYSWMIIPNASIEYLWGLTGGIVDGYILFDVQVNDNYVTEFIKHGIPFVCMGAVGYLGTQNYVGTDWYSGVKESTIFLLSQGYKHIGISIGLEGSIVTKQVFDGYVKGLSDYGLTVDEDLIIRGKNDLVDSIFADLLKIFTQPEMPDALILPERHYYDFLEVEKTLGTSLPVKVILYNYFHTRNTDAGYLDVPYSKIGACAARNIINAINERKVAPIVFTPKLIVGSDSQNESVQINA